jgi:hypothetical protein
MHKKRIFHPFNSLQHPFSRINSIQLFQSKITFFAQPNFQIQTIDQSLNPLKKKAGDINQHMTKNFLSAQQ